MSYVYLRLKGRSKYIFKIILIVSLVTFSSIIFTLTPQLASPHILGKYLKNFGVGIKSIESTEEMNDLTRISFDITFNGKSTIISHLENFTQILEIASMNAFDIFDPLSFEYFAYEFVTINTTQNALLVGVNNNVYCKLSELSQNYSLESAILVNIFDNSSLEFGIHSINIRDSISIVPIQANVSKNLFLQEYPFLFAYLNKTSISDFLFLSLNRFRDLYDSIIMSSSIPYYTSEGFFIFNETQKEIVYWSLNSVENIYSFEEELLAGFKAYEPSAEIKISISTIDTAEQNSYIVNIAHSFIRGIQLLAWTISLIILIISINKIQRLMKEKEIRILLAGQSWKTRITAIVIESSIILISSLIISSIVFLPFIKFQLLFNILLTLTNKAIVDLCIFSSILFVTIITTFIEYEVYLRKLTTSKISTLSEYKPLNLVPLWLKILLSLLLLSSLFLLNRKYSILYIIIIYFIALIITFLVTFIIRLLIKQVIAYITKKKIKAKKKFSLAFILFRLSKKNLLSKLFLYSFMLSLLTSALITANLFSDALYSENTWYIGGEICFNTPASYRNEAERKLKNNLDIIDFTETIAKHTQTSFSKNTQMIGIFYGLNYSDYFNFVKKWNKKNWLYEGSLKNLNESLIYLSLKFKEYGFKIGDRIILIDDSSVTVGGFIDAWPSVSSPDGMRSRTSNIIISNIDLLCNILEQEGINYDYRYMIHSSIKKIETIVDNLVELEYFDELNYIDSSIYEGIKRILLHPIVLFLEIIILFWLSFFIFTNLEDINYSLEAKNLGILALSHNYKKPLLKMKIIELSLHILLFLITSFTLISIVYSIFTIIYGTTFIITFQSWINLLVIFILYPSLLLIQLSVEYQAFKDLDLSIIFRHPE